MGDLNCGMNWIDATSSGQVAELNGTQAMVELAGWAAEGHGNRLQSIRAKLCCCCCHANLPSDDRCECGRHAPFSAAREARAESCLVLSESIQSSICTEPCLHNCRVLWYRRRLHSRDVVDPLSHPSLSCSSNASRVSPAVTRSQHFPALRPVGFWSPTQAELHEAYSSSSTVWHPSGLTRPVPPPRQRLHRRLFAVQVPSERLCAR